MSTLIDGAAASTRYIPSFEERTCRSCGCTEHNCKTCIERTGSPCSWVEADLCSACEEITMALRHYNIDYDGMTNYDLRLSITAFLNKIIPATKTVKEFKTKLPKYFGEQLGAVLKLTSFIRVLLQEYRQHLKTEADLDQLTGMVDKKRIEQVFVENAQTAAEDQALADEEDTPHFNCIFPGADEIFQRVKLFTYDAIAVSSLINKLPHSPYTPLFLVALTGVWQHNDKREEITLEEAVRRIVDSAEFVALLRMGLKHLDSHEVKAAGLSHGRQDGPYTFRGNKDKALGGRGMHLETAAAAMQLVKYWQDNAAKHKRHHPGGLLTDAQYMEIRRIGISDNMDTPGFISQWPGGQDALDQAGITGYEMEPLLTLLNTRFVIDEKYTYPMIGNWLHKLQNDNLEPKDVIDSDYFIAILRHSQKTLDRNELAAFELTEKQQEQLTDADFKLDGYKAQMVRLDNLVTLWRSLLARVERTGKKKQAKDRSEAPPSTFTATQKAAWSYYGIGQDLKDVIAIHNKVLKILDEPGIAKTEMNKMRSLINKAKSYSSLQGSINCDVNFYELVRSKEFVDIMEFAFINRKDK